MANTTIFGWPIPEYQHVPDVPKWNGDLARAIEGTVSPIGQSVQVTRPNDDTGSGWGNFCAAQMNAPAGMMLALGVARWGGKDAAIEITGNGAVLNQILTRHYQLGWYVDTLVGAFYHAGGPCIAGINGAPLDNESLTYMAGSNTTLVYLGRGV